MPFDKTQDSIEMPQDLASEVYSILPDPHVFILLDGISSSVGQPPFFTFYNYTILINCKINNFLDFFVTTIVFGELHSAHLAFPQNFHENYSQSW